MPVIQYLGSKGRGLKLKTSFGYIVGSLRPRSHESPSQKRREGGREGRRQTVKKVGGGACEWIAHQG